MQVVFYFADYDRQYQAVKNGEVDLGFTLAGWLEENAPQDIMDLHILSIDQNISYQGEPYPFVTSTQVVPSPGLSAGPNITWFLKKKILEALMDLTESHPASKAAGISTFTMASSLDLTRMLAQNSGVLKRIGSDAVCVTPFDQPQNFIICPDGFIPEEPDAIKIGCKRKGLPCPPGLLCVCRPCIPVLAVNVFPWQVVLGMCVALFSAGLLLTLGWRVTLEVAEAVEGPESGSYRSRGSDSRKADIYSDEEDGGSSRRARAGRF